MRKSWFALVTLLLSSFALFGQQLPDRPAPPPLDPANNKLDEVLVNWEKAMAGVQSLHVDIVRTKLFKNFQSRDVFKGFAKFLKSNQPGQSSRASLELHKWDEDKKSYRPGDFEKYICTGAFLYEYAPSDKLIRIHQLPPPKAGQVADDNLISFLFGMKAADAKARYELKYVPPKAEDKWYYYLEVRPKNNADKNEFTLARLALRRETSLPAEVWFQEPNGNEVTWYFPKVVNGADIRPIEFGQPALPAGWQFQRMPREPQARVIRQNQ
jgi:TIGR03009 family protein